jgi:urea ABC transporter ATP-binding protein UrtE
MARLLQISDLNVYRGPNHVLRGVSLDVEEGQVVALLGRNGMGKTTLLRSIMGLTPARSGCIRFQGKEMTRLSPHKVAQLGVGYVPQGREIFAFHSVAENLRLGRSGLRDKTIPEEIYDYFGILKERAVQRGGTLSGGEQQMLAIGRALARRPRLLLLDEPSEGIQPSIVQLICQIMNRINREQGTTVLLVEQNVDFAFGMAHYCYILEKGEICNQGPVEYIRTDDVICQHLAV